MTTHLNYMAVRQQQEEIARRAERARQERDGLARAPAPRKRRAGGRLLGRLLRHRSVEAPATSC